MRTCRAFECSSVLRYVLLVVFLGVGNAFAQSTTTVSCFPHHTWNGGDDDEDNDDDHHHFSTWTKSWCIGPTGTDSSGGAMASGTDGTLGGVNSNLSTNGNRLSEGSIAGIVIGVVAALILGLLLALCLRRRYARRRNQARRATFIGPAIASAVNAGGSKEGGAAQMSRTMANVAPSFPPGLHRSVSRDTLPQIPYDTPAYTSTDNLASLTYMRSHTQRESTAVSYSPPSEVTGVTAATAGHGSNGYGNTSFHEDTLMRQKELETTYERKEMGELGSSSHSTASRPDHSAIQMNLPDQAPPRYHN